MKSLVTGADGFVGRWLVRDLQESGHEVIAARRRARADAPRSAAFDVCDSAATARAFARFRPDAVFHLAAVAFGPEVDQSTDEALLTNVGGTMHVLAAASALSHPPVVLIPSSGEVYASASPGPLGEDSPVAPVNAYGCSKAAQEMVAMTYHRAGLLPVVIARAFNHIGPGQRPNFVVSSFASQLAAVALGRRPPVLRVGNLATERDFTDVRDVVAAYRLLADGRHAGTVFNVASGIPVAISSILDRLLEISGLEVSIEVEGRRLRQADPARVVGDANRLRDATGWKPRRPLDQTLADVWADALARASGS